MKNKICLTLAVIFILSVIPTYAYSPTLPYKTSNLISNTDFVLQKVIDCESGGDIWAYNPKDVDGYPKYGLLQFHLPTFISWAEAADIKNADIWNPEQQIEVYHYAAKNGLLRSWGCFTKIFP